jgi:hypothetical protein
MIGLVFVLGGPANVAQREAQRMEGHLRVFLDRISEIADDVHDAATPSVSSGPPKPRFTELNWAIPILHC